MSDNIQVTMLGGCSLTYDDKTLDGNTVCSKRIWMLIEYLLTYRFRCASKEELIDLLYPEEKSKAPQSALKTIIHRARTTLDGFGNLSGKELILNHSGGYRWNPDVNIDIDTEQFERLIREAALSQIDEDSRLLLQLKAIDLYKGDFLPEASTELWSMSITTYFHFLYMNLVHTVIEELIKRDRYNDVIAVSKKAITIDPYDEFLHTNLILALAKTEQLQAARNQYENTTKFFFSELGITPSIELKALYKKLLESTNGVEGNIDNIVNHLQEEKGARGAYVCEYELFKEIYRLEARSAERDKRTAHVCLVSLGAKDDGVLSKKTRNMAMLKLSDCLKNSLRRGDIVSRYSISQLIILLPNTNYKNGEIILKRIINKFHRESPCLPVSVTYSLRALETEK